MNNFNDHITMYRNAWDEWINSGIDDLFLQWLKETYGTSFKIEDRKIIKVTILDEKKHFLLLLKHSGQHHN